MPYLNIIVFWPGFFIVYFMCVSMTFNHVYRFTESPPQSSKKQNDFITTNEFTGWFLETKHNCVKAITVLSSKYDLSYKKLVIVSFSDNTGFLSLIMVILMNCWWMWEHSTLLVSINTLTVIMIFLCFHMRHLFYYDDLNMVRIVGAASVSKEDVNLLYQLNHQPNRESYLLKYPSGKCKKFENEWYS